MNLTNNTRYARSSYAPERLTLRGGGGGGRVDEAEVCEFELVPDEGPQVVLQVVLGPRRLFSLLSSFPGSESFSASPLPGLLTLPLLDSSGAGPGGIFGWLP